MRWRTGVGSPGVSWWQGPWRSPARLPAPLCPSGRAAARALVRETVLSPGMFSFWVLHGSFLVKKQPGDLHARAVASLPQLHALLTSSGLGADHCFSGRVPGSGCPACSTQAHGSACCAHPRPPAGLPWGCSVTLSCPLCGTLRLSPIVCCHKPGHKELPGPYSSVHL